MNLFDRTKHILAFSGIYFLVAVFSWVLLFDVSSEIEPRVVGTLLLAVIVWIYWTFFGLYDKGAEEYEELRKLGPKGSGLSRP